MCCGNRAALFASNHKKRTGFGPHLRIENLSQLWQGGSNRNSRDAFPGGDALRQSCGPVREQSQKANRFWSAPADRKLKSVVARRIHQKQQGRIPGRRCAAAIERPCSRAITKSGQVLVRICGSKTQASCGKADPPERARARSREAMCCGNRAALFASNHKKRTGFGPHLASSRALLHHPFGGYVRSSEIGAEILRPTATTRPNCEIRRRSIL